MRRKQAKPHLTIADLIAALPTSQQRARAAAVFHNAGMTIDRLGRMTEHEIAAMRHLGPKTAASVVASMRRAGLM